MSYKPYITSNFELNHPVLFVLLQITVLMLGGIISTVLVFAPFVLIYLSIVKG